MSILESDWKKFKELRKIALDRFWDCQIFCVRAVNGLPLGSHAFTRSA